MTSESYFRKIASFLNDAKAVQILYMGFFWYWIIICLSQSCYVTKTFCDVTYVKYRPKNALIWKSDFGKPQSWETSHYLSSFKFSGVIWNKIWKEKLISEGIYHKKKTRRGKNAPSRFFFFAINELRKNEFAINYLSPSSTFAPKQIVELSERHAKWYLCFCNLWINDFLSTNKAW